MRHTDNTIHARLYRTKELIQLFIIIKYTTFVYTKYIIINTLYSEVFIHYKCAVFGCTIYLPGNP
jgi:hypothetical protein